MCCEVGGSGAFLRGVAPVTSAGDRKTLVPHKVVSIHGWSEFWYIFKKSTKDADDFNIQTAKPLKPQS